MKEMFRSAPIIPGSQSAVIGFGPVSMQVLSVDNSIMT